MSDRVIVVGGGLAGLIAAGRLRDAGRDVVVVDKGRRPGGRANTREHDVHRFDHGAQFFTVRDPRVEPMLRDWIHTGLVAPWDGRLVRIHADAIDPAKPATRYVGVPGMVDLALALASSLDVRTGIRIEQLSRSEDGWWAVDSDGEAQGPFDDVVVAVPAPQAIPLLSEAPHLRSMAASVDMAPCWAAMLVFDQRAPLDFDGAFVSDGPISWLARNSSKPERPDTEAWVLHATPEWTRRHWNTDRAEVPALLLREAEDRWGPMPNVHFGRAHRWGYALADPGMPPGSLYDPDLRLGVCGDWCVGGRVEGAIVSGIEIADLLGC